MRFDIITLFPQWFENFRLGRIWRDAEANGLLEMNIHHLRDFANDPHRTVDDVPYGGGPGMVLKIEPLVSALESVPHLPGRKVLCASPQGRKVDQLWVEELAQISQLVIVSGRYEGVDERFVEGWVDEEFSIGDYVLSGGDLPALVLMEAVSRIIPGVVGDQESVTSDSFTSGLLKYPQYTRPVSFRGKNVPDVLTSGHHKEIETWRKERSLERTIQRRPDLLKTSENNN